MKIINQNILDVTYGIIVQQVNCLGVMGSGLARQIRDKWPEVYTKYRKKFDDGQWKLGDIQMFPITEQLWMCNIAGQYAYGRDKRHTDYVALERGLMELNTRRNTFQVYIPWNMGCGLGGGNWQD